MSMLDQTKFSTRPPPFPKKEAVLWEKPETFCTVTLPLWTPFILIGNWK